MLSEVKLDEAIIHASEPQISVLPVSYSDAFRIKYFRGYEGTPLDALFQDLIQPFTQDKAEIEFGRISTQVLADSDTLLEQARKVINFGYNSRYVNDGGQVEDITRDRYDSEQSTRTIVSTQEVNGRQVVLSTYRMIVGDRLDVFDLFKIEAGGRWPHADNQFVAGELGRFSLHPIFDVVGVEDRFKSVAALHKRLSLRKIWVDGMQHMSRKGVTHPYFILAPSVRKFVESAGIKPKVIDGVVPNDSEYSRSIRSRFSQYWAPSLTSAEQPTVYIAPWNLEPLVWSSNGTTLRIR